MTELDQNIRLKNLLIRIFSPRKKSIITDTSREKNSNTKELDEIMKKMSA